MANSLKNLLREFTLKLTALYEQMAKNSAEFEGLRKTTKETIAEFKQLLRIFNGNIKRIERERIEKEVNLLSKINALEARPDALSEQALREAVKEEARAVLEKHLVTIKNRQSQSGLDDRGDDLGPTALPPGN